MFHSVLLLQAAWIAAALTSSSGKSRSGGDQYIHNMKESTYRQTLLNRCFQNTSRRFWKRADVPPNARILEIGCGAGFTTRDLALAYPDATILAIDTNPRLVDAASLQHSDLSNVNWAVISGEAAFQQLRDEFDVVWMRFVLVHVPNPQALATSAAICLKPGGKLLIEDCHFAGWFSDPPFYACHMLHDAHIRASLELEGDVRRGPWIGGYMRAAGLSSISFDTFCPIFCKGVESLSPWWDTSSIDSAEHFELGLELLLQSLDSLAPTFLELGICSEKEISQANDSVQAVRNTDYQVFCIPGGHIFQWIGNKPGGNKVERT